MSSLENILNHIEKNTEKEIEEIKNNCFIKAQKLINSAKEEIKKDYEETKKKTEDKKLELRKNFDVELKQIKTKELLCKKEEILMETIEEAKKTFCENKNENYFKFILNIIKKNLNEKENTELIFGEKDFEKIEKFLPKNEKIKIEKSKEFKHGFKIINEKYILNFDIEEIFNSNLEKLKEIACRALDLKDVLTWKKVLIILL